MNRLLEATKKTRHSAEEVQRAAGDLVAALGAMEALMTDDSNKDTVLYAYLPRKAARVALTKAISEYGAAMSILRGTLIGELIENGTKLTAAAELMGITRQQAARLYRDAWQDN